MKIDLTKTLNELSRQIADFIDIDHTLIKSAASNSNGQFLSDRSNMSVSEFLSKYFSEYEIFETTEKQEARSKANTATAIKAKKIKVKSTEFDRFGKYILALWEHGEEFTVSFRKTTHMNSQWHVLSENEIEYKKDGRKFSIVYHTNSRNEVVAKKQSLIGELTNRGMNYKGELPV